MTLRLDVYINTEAIADTMLHGICQEFKRQPRAIERLKKPPKMQENAGCNIVPFFLLT